MINQEKTAEEVELEVEFNRYRNSVYTTESSPSVLYDFLWFKNKLSEKDKRIKELEDELSEYKHHSA